MKNEKFNGLCKRTTFRIASCYRGIPFSDEERFCFADTGGRVTLIESEIDILKENDMYR